MSTPPIHPSGTAPADSAPLGGPASLAELFIAFTALALQGFGGVLPVAQRDLVDRRRWLSREQFLEMLSMGQVLPGPNVVNLSLMIGDRFFGWRGAATAMAGMLLLPFVLVLALAVAYGSVAQAHPAVAGALRGMAAVAAGLLLAMALKLVPALRQNPLGLPLGLALAFLAALAMLVWRWPMVLVVLGVGAAGAGLAWWRNQPRGDA